jgi:hypothetical protein
MGSMFNDTKSLQEMNKKLKELERNIPHPEVEVKEKEKVKDTYLYDDYGDYDWIGLAPSPSFSMKSFVLKSRYHISSDNMELCFRVFSDINE